MPAPRSPTRIGILGGTFDPPHVGHVAAARAVTEQLGLDRLLLVVANDPWQKSGQREISAAEDRFALTEALAEEIPGAEASRLEIDRGGASYSVDTAEEVLAHAGAGGRPVELFLVVGADLVPELASWHRVERPPAAGHAGRRVPPDGGRARPWRPGWRVERVDGPQVAVSSSDVRDRLAAGRPIEGVVPEAVIRCIRRRGLYAVGLDERHAGRVDGAVGQSPCGRALGARRNAGPTGGRS